MATNIKARSNGVVVSLKAREPGSGVFVTRTGPRGTTITSMDRKVYASALASAKEALRKKSEPAR